MNADAHVAEGLCPYCGADLLDGMIAADRDGHVAACRKIADGVARAADARRTTRALQGSLDESSPPPRRRRRNVNDDR